MTQRELVSDILLVGQGLKLSRDTRFRNRHIAFLADKYRARGMREQYSRTPEIESIWVQPMGVLQTTPINSADDPIVAFTSKKLSKITLPPVVALPGEMGVFRIASAANLKRYYYTEFNMMMNMIEDSTEGKFQYYSKLLDSFYLSPCADKVNVALILERPLDGFVIQTERIAQDALIIGTSYTVYDTQIVSDSVSYNPGNVFVATAKTYSGSGYVKCTDGKRKMTEDDPYPMSLTLAEFVMIKIFSNEFEIEKNQLADAIDDAQDQTILFKNSDAARKARESKIDTAASE